MEAVESGQDADGSGPTTAAYVRSLRTSAGLSVDQVAARAGVETGWLEQFEDGTVDEGPNYDLLLRLIAATQPPRPDWWDSGHEHDLHLPANAISGKDKRQDYWRRIDEVRRSNRRPVRS